MSTDKTTETTQILSDEWMARDKSARAALKRLKNILDTPSGVTDENGYLVSNNEAHEDAQSFIRDHLDSTSAHDLDPSEFTKDGDFPPYPALEMDWAQKILNDIAEVWSYEFYRDEISQIAMNLSLCPLHFCDWAGCFDDDDEDCAQIRAIFPHSHDT